MHKRHLPSSRTLGLLAALVVLSLVVAACGGPTAAADLSADGPDVTPSSTGRGPTDTAAAAALTTPTVTTTTAAVVTAPTSTTAGTDTTSAADTAGTAVDNQAAIDATSAAVADLDALLAGLGQDINSVMGDLAADAASTAQAGN